MAIAKHGSGLRDEVRALLSQVHPVFMLPPLAASSFGALVVGTVRLNVLFVHVLAIFFAVYTAHIKDGFVDFYRRGEDDSHPMTSRGCRLALVGSCLGFAACLVYLGSRVGVGAAALTAPTLLLGYFHAPQLDINPVTVTTGYPLGIALAILGGFYAQAETLSLPIVAFASVFLIVLSGVKVVDDAQDYDYDSSIEKRTVAVVLGRGRALGLAYYIMFVGLLLTLWLTVDGMFPPFAFVGIVAYGSVALFARRADPRIATMLLVRGSYLLLAVLIAAVAFEPFAGLPLPDIGVLGSYTYLATEVAFGSVAVVLLYRAGALRDYARSLVVIYPIAYVWDWYTLAVGVFEIPLRTGVTLFGIPLEEHLFILVVPGFVIGVYETVRQRRGDE